ncbi:MAG: hypothetical protein HN509_08965 [Halobacteriovoraceae bacterium]|jgi:hypothetical protein|nr:hypothetical protein [Halobacteriovoraceae bacterium]MBT5094224.1 hypothetical protein [Halobacteriovoraceae bacterium]
MRRIYILILLFPFLVVSAWAKLDCQQLPFISSSAELGRVLATLINQQSVIVGGNRHQLNRKLNECTPSSNSKVLIIAFEGTGAYEPRVPALLNSLNHCIGDKVAAELIDPLYRSLISKLKERYPSKTQYKWSGLDTGILSELFKIEGGEYTDWYSFPSEEAEALSGLEELKNLSIGQLYRDIKNSVNSRPIGIQNALACVRNYRAKAKKLGIAPKIVGVSHSSGARSLVKFSEQLAKEKVKIDLLFTIDPLIEAHETIKEILPQKLGEPARWARYQIERMLGRNPRYPHSKVWSRYHPNSLYTPSNVQRLQSFYQLDDVLGLKIGGDALRFGILGSKFSGTDQNHLIRETGISGHGTICYHPTVLQYFRDEISQLLK